MLMTIVWFSLFMLSVFFGIFHFFGNKQLYNETEHINGPRVFPLIGCSYKFLGNTSFFVKQLLQVSKTYISPFRLVFGSRVFILIQNPNQIKFILQSPCTVEKDSAYNFVKPLLGNGLLAAKQSSTGVSVKKQKREIDKFFQASSRVLKLIAKRFIQFWLHSDLLYKLSQQSKDFNGCVKYIHSFLEKIIHEKKQNDNRDVKNKRKIILDLLLEISNNGNKFTDEEIRNHLVTFILGGTDTAARTIEFVFLMLAHHPEIQDNVYNELYNIYGLEDPEKYPVRYEDLHELTYLERVIKETLRIFPVVPFTARQVSKDFDLDGCKIRKGCGVVMFTLGLHRDEKIWTNPLKFDPDRFLPDEISKQHSCAFIPFSYGTRDCLGRVYAMIAMKIIIATFLRKYIVKKDTFTEPGDIKLKLDTLLLPEDPITLRLEKRVN